MKFALTKQNVAIHLIIYILDGSIKMYCCSMHLNVACMMYQWCTKDVNIDCRMYQDKLAQLKAQLQQLQDATLPEYMKKLKKIQQHYKERLRLNEIWYNYEVWLNGI